jgi:cell division protein FtsI/penicillin-binding protein 2
MTRRDAAALLLSPAACAFASSPARLDAFIGDIPGAALLVDVRTRALIAVHHADLAGGLLVPPGSAIKPFTLEALLRSGKMRADERFPCPGKLSIGGRAFNCSHPPVATPIDVTTALAYSCNCLVAHYAARFAPGELAAELLRSGLAAQIDRATTRDAQQLQAIGEAGVLVTPAEMAQAYRRLALSAPDPIRRGLEAAVEFGTAQNARVAGTKVAGKTGSVRANSGAMFAWFCGFAPCHDPSVVVTVVLEARSGGADAAPLAAKILQAHFAGRV